MGRALAISALILGLISLAIMWTGYVALIVGVLAIILAAASLSKYKDGKVMATIGLIAGILGSILGLLFALVWTGVGVALFGS